MLDCEGSFNSVEPIRSLSEMEPSGVSVEVTQSCTNKDHCQSVSHSPVNPPAALFRRHGDLQVGVFMGSNGGRGTMSFADPLSMAF